MPDRGQRRPGALGTRLRACREAAGLSQSELAGLAGLSTATVQDIEQGRTARPRNASLRRLGSALRLDDSQLAELIALAAPPAAGRAPSAPGPRSRLRLEVLGPVTATRDGAPVALGPIRQRAVLALLVLHAGTGLSRAAIVDALWVDDPPAAAVVMVQGYVTRLRRALGAAAGAAGPAGRAARDSALLWDGACYRLATGAVWSDWNEFTDVTGQARQAAMTDPPHACELYERALRLWHADPLADIEFLSGHPAVTELSRLRAAAVVDYATVAGLASLHEQVIGHLRALTAREPLNERAHARLIVALAATGQQAAALEAYEELRQRLDDELGMTPGRELADAHLLVLRQQVSPAAAPLPLERDVPRQLPAPVRHFAGRASELRTLTRLLDQAAREPRRTVVISAIGGTAGVGKTALAVHWAHLVADRFPDGQLHVNLRGFDPAGPPVAPADAIRRFLDALGVPANQISQSTQSQQDMYRSLLARRRMLILLDNARDADQVRPLLPGGAGCLVLVTSRNELTSLVAAEGAHPVSLHLLSPPDARELLARRLGPERVAAEPGVAGELTLLCARLPLAVSIAAARAAMHPRLPLATLVKELRDATGRLDALDAGDQAGSVRAVFSWSYRSLGEPTARMFRLLGLHPGPDISVAAAASLAGTGPARARDALARLAGANLITEQLPGRFAFHDLLRVYAAERAAAEDDEPDRRAAMHRMLDHYLHTAHAAAITVYRARDAITLPPPQPKVLRDDVGGYEQAMAWFQAEQRVLLAAADQAASAGFDTHAWQIPSVMAIFFARQGSWHEHRSTQCRALAAAQRLGDTEGQAVVHRTLGHIDVQLGSYRDAMIHFGVALDLYQQLRDPAGQGRVYVGLGGMFDRQGRYREALESSMTALCLYQVAGDRAWQAATLNNIGWCHARLSDYRQALTYCGKAKSLHQELGDRHGEAYALDSLGYAYAHLGRHAEAVSCYRQALALFRDLHDRFNQADKLVHLGDALHSDGKPQLAAQAWRQALTIFDALHYPGADQVRAKLGPAPVQRTIVTQSK
jgi:DNA-binding SARP family transcriptional activator/tetratricopeptide (TPR) repeat protein/transcriptional regulator with XRE-family HTH domain